MDTTVKISISILVTAVLCACSGKTAESGEDTLSTSNAVSTTDPDKSVPLSADLDRYHDTSVSGKEQSDPVAISAAKPDKDLPQKAALDNSNAEGVKQAVRDFYSEIFRRLSPDFEGDFDPTLFLSKNFTRDWNLADSVSERSGYIWIDWDPWLEAQDYDNPALRSVVINYCSGNKAEVTAFVSVYGDENTVPIDMRLVREDGQWRVDDFISGGTSVRTVARDFLIDQ